MGYNQLRRLIINQRVASALRELPTLGNIYYVFNTSDAYYTQFEGLVEQTYADGTEAFHTTLASAIAACTDGRNDVILLDAKTEHLLTAGIAMTKSRVHIVGMDWGDRLVQQGAKIKLATAATTAYVMKDTGNRNSFRNIKFIQAATAGTGLTVFQGGGEGTVFKNCSFVFEVADNLGSTDAHEFVAGTDSATFIDCTFWNDTLVTSAARSVFHVDMVTASQEFKSNRLRNCTFMIASSSATATFVRLDAITDILFTNIFEDCVFAASVCTAAGTIAVAEASQTGTGTNKWNLLYVRPAALNVTDFATATGGRNVATQVVAAVSVAAAIEGITPTA